MSSLDETEVTHTGVIDPEPRPDGLAPGDQVDRFTIVGQIGSGGMGRIFEAHDPNLQRRVALKVLHARGSEVHRQRLLREAQALARLGHPNVITVHEVGNHDGSLFIAMELVTGGTLKDWLEVNPPGDEARQADALRLLVDAGRGILAAHGAGLIHRDVKPSNILIGTDGRARVADFGIVRTVADASVGDVTSSVDVRRELYDSKTGTLTRSGAAVGTPAYMAPEQFDGRDVGEAADQFSFCVTAWETLLGERPFKGATVGEVLGSIRDGRPEPEDASSIPDALAKSLRKGLNLRARDRHRSLGLLVDDLESFATNGRPAPRPLRRGLVVALGGGALVASVAAYRAGTLDGPCPTAKDRFASVWSDTRAREFAARGDAWSEPVRRLDAYATAWVAAYDDACEDARIRGAQTEAQMLERQACLDAERDALGTVVGTAEAAAAIIDAVAYRGQPTVCDAGFGVTLSLPPEQVARLDAVTNARSEGRFRDALDRLDVLRNDGRLSPGLEAREAYERGMSSIPLGQQEQGYAHLELSFETAVQHHQSSSAIRAALSLSQFSPGSDASLRQHWLAEAKRQPGIDGAEHARMLAMTEFLAEATNGDVGRMLAAVDRITSNASPYRSDPGFLLRAAKILLQNELDLDRALAILERVESDSPDLEAGRYSPIALRCYGLAQAGLPESSAACKLAIERLGLRPRQDYEAVRGALSACQQTWAPWCEDAAESAEAMLHGPTFGQQRMSLLLDLADYYKDNQDRAQAEKHSRAACRSTAPSSPQTRSAACTTYAATLLEGGDKERAKAELDHASRILTDDLPATRGTVVAHANVAGVYNELKLTEQAFRHSQRAATLGLGTPLEQTSTHKLAQLNYCGDSAAHVPAAESMRICEAASEAVDEPRFAGAAAAMRLNLGVAYFKGGRFEDAAAAYESAKLGLEGSDRFPPRAKAIVRANLGEVYESMSKFADARTEYEDAFARCKPTWSTYYFAGTGLVRTLARTGAFDQAKAVLTTMRKATSRNDTKARALLEEAAAVLAETQGSAKRAASSYARAVDLYELAGADEDVTRICAAVKPVPRTCPR